MLREEPALLSLCLAFTVQDGRRLSVPGPMADSVGRLGLAYLVRFSSLASLCPAVQQHAYDMTHFASAATVGQRCERIVSCNPTRYFSDYHSTKILTASRHTISYAHLFLANVSGCLCDNLPAHLLYCPSAPPRLAVHAPPTSVPLVAAELSQ